MKDKSETTSSCVLSTVLPCWFHNIKLPFFSQSEIRGNSRVEFSVSFCGHYAEIPVLIEVSKYCITNRVRSVIWGYKRARKVPPLERNNNNNNIEEVFQN